MNKKTMSAEEQASMLVELEQKVEQKKGETK